MVDVEQVRVVARRMEIILLLDTSGSMLPDGKIQSLNTAIEEAIPHLRRAFGEIPDLDADLRVVAFGSSPRWVIETPRPIDSLVWPLVEAEEEGLTEIGAAIDAAIDALERDGGPRAVPAGLVLVSDGMPTDTTQPTYAEAIARLDASPATTRATRLAVGIGNDVDLGTLERFCSPDGPGPTRADDPQQLMVAMRNAANSLARSATEAPG